MENKSQKIKGLFITILAWAIVIGGIVLWFSHNNTKKNDEAKEFQAYRDYNKKHPEENEIYAVLAAKYAISPGNIQDLLNGFSEIRWEKHNKDFSSIILALSKKFDVSESTVASIYIDHESLTLDCSRSEN